MTHDSVLETDFRIPVGKFPRDVLDYFILHSNHHSRESCIKAFEKTLRSKELMVLQEKDAKGVVEVFEALITAFHTEGKTERASEWNVYVARVLMEAYLHASKSYDDTEGRDSSSKTSLLSGALSFLIRLQLTRQPLLDVRDGLKKVTFLATKTNHHLILPLEEYLISFLKHALRIRKQDDNPKAPITPEEWAIPERVLKFCLDVNYYPQGLIKLLPELVSKVSNGKDLFYRDTFGDTLWHKATHQVSYAQIVISRS